jgi:hypothetical protein
MTRRFKPADYSFHTLTAPAVDGDPVTALDGRSR